MSRSFNGSSSNHLDAGNHCAIGGEAMTMHCWANLSAFNAPDNRLFGKWTAGDATREYFLNVNPSGQIGYATRGIAGYFIMGGTGTPITLGSWYAIGGRRTGRVSNGGTIWRNGVIDATATPANDINGDTNIPLLMGDCTESAPITGLLAEVAVWNVGLLDSEMVALSQGTSPLGIQNSNLLGYWPLCGQRFPEPDVKAGNSAAQVGTVPAGSSEPFWNTLCHPPVVPIPQFTQAGGMRW